MPVLVTSKFEKDLIKNNREKVETCCFPHWHFQWALSVAIEPVLIQSAPKPYAAFSSTPVILHTKFDQDWPSGFRDIQVQKCGRRQRMADHWYTISSPCEPSAQLSKNVRQTESGRTMTIRINHNRSTALERSVINYWGLNQFYMYTTLTLDSALVHKHTRYSVRMKKKQILIKCLLSVFTIQFWTVLLLFQRVT